MTRRIALAVTTVPERRDTLLPRTLASLKAAGFPPPRLFVDNCTHRQALEYEERFGLPVNSQHPPLRTFGNWFNALGLTYLRDPTADLFAVAQDDILVVGNLCEYLLRVPFPEKGYWNCYTFPVNQALAPRGPQGQPRVGWYRANQLGKGAVLLVFDKKGVAALFGSPYMAERVLSVHRGHKSVDGGVVSALRQQGYTEYVHYPSLTQHTGAVSSMGNRPHKQAPSFPGESHDALAFLEGQ